MKNAEHLRPFRPDQTVILVAEDDILVQNIARISLERDGYFLLTAHDGEEALEISRNFPGTIHLLLTDIDMPRLNGLELCQRLAKDRPDTGVLMMSGNPPQDRFRGPFLHKPFTMQELRAKVRELIAEPVVYAIHPCHDAGRI